MDRDGTGARAVESIRRRVTGQGVAYEVNERHAGDTGIAATARTKMKVRRARIENL